MPELLKIVLTGPESSGKTTLAESLSAYYHTLWVPEYAREYLTSRDGKYTEGDLTRIAQGQIQLEDEVIKTTQAGILFFDTNLLTIEVWANYKYGRIDPFISALLNQRNYDVYFLCSPEIGWEPDPLRENPNDRWKLFSIYENCLKEMASSYLILEGNNNQRVHKAANYLRHKFEI